jgi:hypothetical protein
MALQPFIDYYRVLEVAPSATQGEIRQAFRRLVLKAHPDKNPRRTAWSERRIRELIEAYETIGNREKRLRFDQECRQRRDGPRRTAPTKPKESEFFFFKKSDPGACALRILYFLLHGRGAEALPLLGKMEAKRGPGFLREELDVRDYLDCLFLLGEYHIEKREYREALRRLRAFYLHERHARFPRHYLDAVVAHLKDLYLRKLPQTVPPLEALDLLQEAGDLDLGKRERESLSTLSEALRSRLRGRGAAEGAGGRGKVTA